MKTSCHYIAAKSVFCRRLLAVSVCALLILLSACANRVTSTISTFRSDTNLPVGARVAVHADTEVSDELEFGYFRRGLARELTQAGFNVVEEADRADMLVSLSYETLRRERDSRGSRAHIQGSIGYRSRYGQIIYVEDGDDEFEFLRKVKIKFSKKAGSTAKKGEDLLSLTALSAGKCGFLVTVYDEMLQAIFTDLNRGDGSVVKVSVKSEGRCVRGA